MSHKSDLLKEIRETGKKLIHLSKWYRNNRPFGHIDNDCQDDYVYEFYCYLKILRDLKTNYKVVYEKGVKGFPAKSASKSGHSKFILKDKINNNIIYQVCSGTQIIKCNGEVTDKDAPDISFQTPDSNDNPTFDDVLMIMDAKYKTDPDNKLNKPIIEQFAKIVLDLKVENAGNEKIDFHKYVNLKGNCLITNGLAHAKKEKYCINNYIKQVENFDIGKDFKVIG